MPIFWRLMMLAELNLLTASLDICPMDFFWRNLAITCRRKQFREQHLEFTHIGNQGKNVALLMAEEKNKDWGRKC